MPALPPRTTTRQFTFSFGDQTLPLSIALDQTVVQWMKNYPIIQESAYFEAPFSPTLRASLLPQVKDLIKNKAPMDALALMVALTRSAFRYQEDGDYFGHSKPMIPEEVFYYPFSDCEDRSALLFSLIREFLYFPAIVVAYPNHVTVAVDLPNLDGEFITHKGRRYYICDPTGPSSSSLFNEIPSSFAGQAFEILKEYK